LYFRIALVPLMEHMSQLLLERIRKFHTLEEREQ
jgi:hypothetical protein